MAVVLLALPIALVGLVLALLRRVVVTVGVNEHSGVVEIARHTRRWRVVGLLLGAVAAVLLLVLGQRVDALGRAAALAPTALGAGVLLGTIVGELTARPSVGIRRSAAVETRTLGSILPRGRAVVLAVSTGLLVGALAIGAAWGSADDLGRAGRLLSRQCVIDATGVGPVLVGSSRGPWPGSFYAVPLAVALLVLAVLVAVALRAVVNRPRPELDSRGLDTMLRRWSVGNVLTAATVTVLGTLGPVALLMVSALAGGTARDRLDTVVAASPRSSGRWPPGPRSACSPGWCSPRPSGSTTCRVRCPAGPPRRGAGAMTLSTVTVDVLDPTPPYEQLRRQLADLIGSGVLSPGDRLPRCASSPSTSGSPPARWPAPTASSSRPATCARAGRRHPGRHHSTRPADPRACPRGGRRGLPRAGAGAGHASAEAVATVRRLAGG